MSRSLPTYAVVTPAHDEAGRIETLAAALAKQSQRPTVWIVVDDRSSDETGAIVAELSHIHPWIHLIATDGEPTSATRGAPIVRAFQRGLEAVDPTVDVVVKLDADLSFDGTYFEALMARFAADERLGIASGTCLERDASGQWRGRFGTGTGVWGACRAYRRACLDQIVPLAERQGWDEIDALMAVVRGWHTRAFEELPFYHHRREGERDGSRLRVWMAQGEVAHFIGYRPSYVALRTIFRARLEPAACAIAAGYIRATLVRAPRLDDPAAVAHLRELQRLRHLRTRAREARGEAAVTPSL